MPPSPVHHEVSLIYNSITALKFGDTYNLEFAGLMNAFKVTHVTWKKNTYDMLGF